MPPAWFDEVQQPVAGGFDQSVAADTDLDFNEAVADPGVVEDAWATWRASVAYVDRLIATQSLDTEGVHDRGRLQLREVLVHLIEEYARHLGHADLLRECIDGRTGQLPAAQVS